MAFVALMLSVAIFDFCRLIIPNAIVIVGAILGIVLAVVNSFSDLSDIFLAGLASAILLAVVRWAGNKLLQRESMGMGDVKLAGVIGLFIGFLPFLIALWMASVAGAGYGLLKIRNPKYEYRNKFEIRSAKVPFGAFLAMSSVAVVLFRDEIPQILQSWSWLTLNP